MTGEGKIPSSSVLVVTFSRAAAVEMKERFFEIYRTEQYPGDFRDLSRSLLRILKQAYNLTSANILSEEEKNGSSGSWR